MADMQVTILFGGGKKFLKRFSNSLFSYFDKFVNNKFAICFCFVFSLGSSFFENLSVNFLFRFYNIYKKYLYRNNLIFWGGSRNFLANFFSLHFDLIALISHCLDNCPDGWVAGLLGGWLGVGYYITNSARLG